MSAALVLFLFHCFYPFLGIIRNLKATTYGGYYYGRCRPCDRRPIRIQLFKGQILIASTGSLHTYREVYSYLHIYI
ncbi:hypothetical protein B0H13DRAFT_2035622 [Mycena leptocephala]|nr:hypothetical protein B0H13DRAFT_2035622 [Mycena leptocephala]